MQPTSRLVSRWLALLAALMTLLASASALAQADPPGRVAHLSWREGSIVFAPDGENEWVDLPANRPLTRGDRLWTDRGARAELHLGSATLHVAGQSHLAFYELDDDAVQLSLTQGTVSARVRDLAPRENVEIDTPNLAARALQPGDWRVDVDPANGITRVAVRSGRVVLYGERGESLTLAAGQQMAFGGRSLQQAGYPGLGVYDAFDSWAAERNRLEDQSISARYIPREVIGYQQLDSYGNWVQDPGYGPVWYPRITVADWAPYRYGRWTWIQPWGWTWVDDAPWGFAPFHYGRWALIGSRWAWVPGRIGPRPVYAPALVVFVGGSNWSIRIGSDPGIAWYPLAPGEAWWPTYRTSNVYVTNVNRYIPIDRQQPRPNYVFRQRPEAITGLPITDFSSGRPVRERWQRVQPAQIANAPPVNAISALPRPERFGQQRREPAPRLQQTPPPAAQPAAPGAGFAPPGLSRPMPVTPGRPEAQPNPRFEAPRAAPERAQREQEAQPRPQREAVQQQQERIQQERDRAAREQERQQREQERAQRDQQERAQREAVQRQQQQQQQLQQRAQQEQERAAREQERQQREQERAQRDQQERAQREAVQRQQQQQQQLQQRAQQEQERAAREQERAQRDKQERAQREAIQRQQQQQQQLQQRAQQQQERAAREQERIQREQQRPQQQQQQQQRGEPARIGPQPRPQRDDDEQRGRGQGRGNNG